jgi:kanamycin nucleotidyltransferase
MNEITQHKRQAFLQFVERVLEPEPCVQGVIVTGSLASGTARPDSDIDAILFYDPYDPYIVPAEFRWRTSDGSFHNPFTSDPAVQADSLQLDFDRLQLAPGLGADWLDGRRAELAGGWLAFDREGRLEALLPEWTRYPEALRQTRLDVSLTWIDQHLGLAEIDDPPIDWPQVRWDSLGPLVAHDRLSAAYDYLVEALFAANRRWRTWRNREMTALLRLPWLPPDCAARLPQAVLGGALDYEAYLRRVAALKSLTLDLLAHLQSSGDYGSQPFSEAFIRQYEEPGRAWNMDAWNAEHARKAARPSSRFAQPVSLLSGPMPLDHTQRYSLAEQIADRLRMYYGERLTAVGIYGSLARQQDGPYSDIEMHALVKGEAFSACHEWSAGPWKAEVDVYSLDAALAEAAGLEDTWSITHGAFVSVLPLFDPHGWFELLRQAALQHSPAEFRQAIRDTIVGDLYELVGKLRNSGLPGASQDLVPMYAVELATYSACLVGLSRQRPFASGGSLFAEALSQPDLPQGLAELCRTVTAGKLSDAGEIRRQADVLWRGLEAWAAAQDMQLTQSLDEVLPASA